MGFQFAESMSGTFELDAGPGKKYPLKFEITAQAESTRAHLRDGKAEVRGVLTAPPLAGSTDVEGTITIRPIGQRIIRYELRFVGDDGRGYELVGQKDIRLRSLRHSFTYLPAEILDEDHRRVATCQTTFDLRHDGWSFLRSFRYLRPI